MSPQNGAKVINPISFTAANGKKSNQAQEKVNQRKIFTHTVETMAISSDIKTMVSSGWPIRVNVGG